MQRQRPDIESSVSRRMLLACVVSLILLLLLATPERERAVNDDVFGSDMNNFDFVSGHGIEAQHYHAVTPCIFFISYILFFR